MNKRTKILRLGKAIIKGIAMGVLFSLLLSSIALQCARADFDLLNKGDAAPYRGYLITPEREQDLRLMSKKLELSEQLNKQYQTIKDLDSKTVDVLNQRVTLLQDENLRLGKEMVDARGDGFWNKFAYFLLGVGATTLAVYGVHQVTK